MEGWKEYKLDEFVHINPSILLSRKNEYFYIEMQDMDPTRKLAFPKRKRPLQGGSRFKEGDTLFARISRCLEKGNINQARGLGEEFGFGSTEFLVFRERDGISDGDFITYLSKYDAVKDYGANNLQGTSGRQRVSKEAFYELELLLPPLPEQKTIASVLSSLDDKIDLLHRQIKTLEQLAETLFRQWFVEEANESREVGTLGDLVEVKYGKDHKKLEDGNIPVYGSGGVMRYADQALFEDESVLIPRKGSLNNVLYVNEAFWTVDAMFFTLMKKPNIAKFVYHFVKAQDLASMNVGSAVPSMTTVVLNNMPVEIPSPEVFEKYEAATSPLYEKRASNLKQIKNLTSLRDTLLPKLMSGEVRVEME